jgi:hypothetical protein
MLIFDVKVFHGRTENECLLEQSAEPKREEIEKQGVRV